MKREIILTSDGSSTIHIPDWNEQYHSKHGAIQEAYHVFIKNGLEFISNTRLSVLEMGFGTGLNAFITYLEAKRLGIEVDYTGLEAYPVPEKEVVQLNYVAELDAAKEAGIFEAMHEVSWEETHELASNFCLTKRQQFFQEITDQHLYDLIYFDAFGARVQPELWTESIFQSMYAALKIDGVLVTYAAKGSVRRAMQAVGFEVERLQGPPGKRHMLRAIKKQ